MDIKERTVWKSQRKSLGNRNNKLIIGKTCLVMAAMALAKCKAGSIHIQLQPQEIQENNNLNHNPNIQTFKISK